ncbi:helix-turn-helix domain-containing protein [Streptomyces sp. NPDC057654]|uniref:helix-turn-helix domain-containing protein n=1 Tax=Streptomyces sp. NPDC057654 TaxID=3346196 RepID=UPI00368F8D0C
MGLRTNPTQLQRRLGRELRQLRVRSGMSAIDAGALVGLGGPHLSHIEAGRTAIPEPKLRTLTRAYGCKSGTYVEALVAMARGDQGGWWRGFRHDVDARALDLAELEAASPSFSGVETVNMPGLLQTPEYAKALLETRNRDADATRRFCEFRLRRQEVLTRDPAPNYHAIIHEAVFHMYFVDPEVLRRQLTHLIDVARLPNITIQIVPFRSGPLPAVGGPFVLFGGAEPELSTVYMEHDVGADFLSTPEHIARYRTIFDRLSVLALPPLVPETERRFTSQRDSLSLLQHLLYIL